MGSNRFLQGSRPATARGGSGTSSDDIGKEGIVGFLIAQGQVLKEREIVRVERVGHG
jgi:hypothetical protein